MEDFIWEVLKDTIEVCGKIYFTGEKIIDIIFESTLFKIAFHTMISVIAGRVIAWFFEHGAGASHNGSMIIGYWIVITLWMMAFFALPLPLMITELPEDEDEYRSEVSSTFSSGSKHLHDSRSTQESI